MKKIFLAVFLVLIFFVAGCSSNIPAPASEELREFATCLTENGARIFGATWCPHCVEQKEMFGDAISEINYIECTEEKQKCEDENITLLPTWRFEDKSEVTGVQTFAFLAEKTGCSLPS
jgi:hypothetical protein